MNKKIRYTVLNIFSFLITSLTCYLFFSNIHLLNILKEKPTDVIVANLSTTSAEIYWKADSESIHTISYKKSSDSGTYKEITNAKLYLDNLTGKKLYIANIPDLEANSEYVFQIESGSKVWTENMSFKTKDIADDISLPEIATGDSNSQSFILVKTEEGNKMLNTQYHGTYAFDTENQNYEPTEYANYTSAQELENRLLTLLHSPVYAESGANCKTGVTINDTSYGPSKAKAQDILNRWVQSCPKGGYPDECFEDVYCKALAGGVKPSFVVSIWSNESGGSNYAYIPRVEDFGIHNLDSVPVRDFTAQINKFVKHVEDIRTGYMTACTDVPGDPMYKWGAIFWKGNCDTPEMVEFGRQYITQISEIHSWYMNAPLTWPFTISSNSSACSYSGSYTNTTYNSCTTKGSPTQPPGEEEEPEPTIPPGGDGDIDDMIVTDKDRYCADPDGCRCQYDGGSTILNAKDGYTCTVDKKVIKTVEVCCQEGTTLSFEMPYDCTGTVLEGITEANCKAQVKDMDIKEGVNFIEAINISNKEEVPVDTAKGLIEYSENKIIVVGAFRNDQWEKVIKYEDGQIKGEDFNLEPGDSYLVVSTEDMIIPVQGLPSSFSIELNTLTGWNLVPSSLFKSVATTSKSLLKNTKYTYIKQIAQWEQVQSMFDYTIRDNDGTIYGEDLKISNTQGIFVKIPQ